jgi:hypothetical protein
LGGGLEGSRLVGNVLLVDPAVLVWLGCEEEYGSDTGTAVAMGILTSGSAIVFFFSDGVVAKAGQGGHKNSDVSNYWETSGGFVLLWQENLYSITLDRMLIVRRCCQGR